MALRAADLKVGDRREQVVVEDLTRTQLVQYAGASGDYNPLHTDEPFARQVSGHAGVFAHGMLTMGLTGKAVTDWVGDGRLVEFGVRFVAQVWPGDTLMATVTVRAIGTRGGAPVVELDVSSVNQDGVEVITGTAVALLDP